MTEESCILWRDIGAQCLLESFPAMRIADEADSLATRLRKPLPGVLAAPARPFPYQSHRSQTVCLGGLSKAAQRSQLRFLHCSDWFPVAFAGPQGKVLMSHKGTSVARRTQRRTEEDLLKDQDACIKTEDLGQNARRYQE